jgi:hypothetical protein
MTVFKINNISDTAKVDGLLKTQYIKSFAIPADIISFKKIFADEWNKFKEEKVDELKRRKEQNNITDDKRYTFNYTDYSFIRDFLSKIDKPSTNIDFILQVILKNKKQNSSVYKQLLKLKTEELVLWNIAKTYWKKANGNDYNVAELKGNTNSKYFKEYCSFSRVYDKDLDYKIEIKENFWHEKNKKKFKKAYELLPENNKTISFTIKVPARKYDNKFLSVETELIKEYVLWNHLEYLIKYNKLPVNHTHQDFKNVIFDLNQYEDIIKMVNKELIQSVSDILQILRAEKRIVDKDRGFIKQLLMNKYEGVNPIKTFYLTITDKTNMVDKQIFDKFILEIDHASNIYEKEKKEIKEYLVSFRNFALHYQLQDNDRKKAVLKLLNKINDGEKNDEFFSNEF